MINKKLLTRIAIFLAITVIIIQILEHRKNYNNNKTPDIYQATVISPAKEIFKSEIVLYNLDFPLENNFFPPQGYEFNINQRPDRTSRKNSNVEYPRSMALLPGDDILVSTHYGRLLLYSRQKNTVTLLEGLPDDIANSGYQQGILNVSADPEYKQNKNIFLSYSATRANAGNKSEAEFSLCLIRAKLSDKQIDIEDRYCAQPWNPAVSQYGGGIAMDHRGYLYLAVGDRAKRNAAQKEDRQWGKVLRLDKHDFSKAPGNFLNRPFADGYIYSVGHRNPQGLFFDNEDAQLFLVEHGPRGGDEVNQLRQGDNYGWPIISYGREYNKDQMVGIGTRKLGMAQPLYYYVPSIAPSALLLYRGELFPEWQGSIFVTALAGLHLNRLQRSGSGVITAEERLLTHLQSRFRDIREADDGSLYLLSEDGFIMRLYR